MISPTTKLTAIALAMAALTAISLASYDPAFANEPVRKPVYSEGLWKEPAKPGKTAEPPAPVHGIGAGTEPIHGTGAKPPPSSALPPVSR
jgi:hypothetical protein